jgi:hypothetical protein
VTPRSRLCGTAPAAITAAAATGRKRRERCCCRRSRSLRCCCRYFDGKRRVDHHGHRLCHLPRVEHCGERHTTRAECPTLFLSLMPGGSVRALTSIFLPFATDLTWSIPVNLKWRHRCALATRQTGTARTVRHCSQRTLLDLASRTVTARSDKNAGTGFPSALKPMSMPTPTRLEPAPLEPTRPQPPTPPLEPMSPLAAKVGQPTPMIARTNTAPTSPHCRTTTAPALGVTAAQPHCGFRSNWWRQSAERAEAHP